MTYLIKIFIERNIDLIENNKWEQLLLDWYNEIALDIWPDAEEFEELCNILIAADIIDLETILKTAKLVLYPKIHHIMKTMKKEQQNEKVHHIDTYTIFNKLNSQLGYDSVNTLQPIMDKVASGLKLTYTDYYGGGYTW